jgi:hypothetical protein
MIFLDNEKKFLQALGRSSEGRELVQILERVKKEFSSIDSIDGTKDYGAQVEGRKLFGTFVDALTKQIMTQKHVVRPLDRDDYT